MSSTIRRSMRPPRLECHSGPEKLTIPRRALAPPAPSAPIASAMAPGLVWPETSSGAEIESAGFRIAILVLGSRPATLAVSTEPFDPTSSNSSLRGSDCSEATTTPDRHTRPVTCRSCLRRMATTEFLAASARATSAPESWLNGSAGSGIGNSYRFKIGMNLRDSSCAEYRPDGRVRTGHLTGVCSCRQNLWKGSLPVALFRQCAPQLLDERRQISVVGRDGGQPLGIGQRRYQVATGAIEGDQRRQDIAIAWMSRQALHQHLDGLVALSARVQRDRIDVNVPRTIGPKFGRLLEFGKGRVRLLEPGQGQAKRVMRRGLARRSGDCRKQHGLSFIVAAELPVQVSQIDRGSEILRAQSQCCFIFHLCRRCFVASSEEASQCGAGFGPLGIGALRIDEFGRSALKALAIGRGLARCRDGREQRGGADTDTAYGIGQERRNPRPDLAGRHAFEHIECSDPYHRVG